MREWDRPLNYILDADGEPKPASTEEWALWFERASKDRSRIIAHDRDESGESDVLVSTVFLGLDHNFSMTGPPVLWETMVMGGPLDGEQNRYTSREAAFRGHQAMCQRVAEANAAARTKDGDRIDGGFQETDAWPIQTDPRCPPRLSRPAPRATPTTPNSAMRFSAKTIRSPSPMPCTTTTPTPTARARHPES